MENNNAVTEIVTELKIIDVTNMTPAEFAAILEMTPAEFEAAADAARLPAVAEYGSELARKFPAIDTPLASGGPYIFAHRSAGYVIAGSALRLTRAVWRVIIERPDGTTHGREFLNRREAEAEFFNKLIAHKVAERELAALAGGRR